MRGGGGASPCCGAARLVHEPVPRVCRWVAVDLTAVDSCSCNRGAITGVPCAHQAALANAVHLTGTNARAALRGLVHSDLRADAALALYDAAGSLAVNVDASRLQVEPLFLPQTGRQERQVPPRLKRRRAGSVAVQSGAESRSRRTVTCTNCGGQGHNSRTCTAPPGYAAAMQAVRVPTAAAHAAAVGAQATVRGAREVSATHRQLQADNSVAVAALLGVGTAAVDESSSALREASEAVAGMSQPVAAQATLPLPRRRI